MTSANYKTFENADLLFEYIAGTYSNELIHGGFYKSVLRAKRLVKVLSEMTGESFEFWMNQLVELNEGK